MASGIKLPFFTLLLLISFASVNALLFTPALPEITHFFQIGTDQAQLTITWFLIGYTLSQLLYGPLANRFGRKPALYLGTSLQIISSLICALSGYLHLFPLLIFGRFMLALGSGVGLKMTFTLVNECYDPQAASKKIAHVTLAFAIMPGLAVALGGLLSTYYGWPSCFIAGALYGLTLFIFIYGLPETSSSIDKHALKIPSLFSTFAKQFKNPFILTGGLLMGLATCFVYVFAALAPFIAINLLGMNPANYGLANLLPPIGLILGSLLSGKLVNYFSTKILLYTGITIASLGVILMFLAFLMHFSACLLLFTPMIIIYLGLCFIMANASSFAMSKTTDKAHGSAVMNFLNIGSATCTVLSLRYFPIFIILLPTIYLILCLIMISIIYLLTRLEYKTH